MKIPYLDLLMLDPLIQRVLKCLRDWYFVGGSVRDSILGLTTYDIDIVTLMLPDEIQQAVEGFSTSVVGKRFGTIGVFVGKWKIEITTTRLDITTYGRQADVLFTNSFQEDSNRRDFTMNALLYNGQELLDFHNGVDDLHHKMVRFIGNAEKRIQEDYLRIFRYIRFFVRYGNNQPQYQEIIQHNLQGLHHVSKERIVMEVNSMAMGKHTSSAVELINAYGISDHLWQKPLPIDPDLDRLEPHIKMARIFRSIKNLPLPKNVSKYINLFQIADNLDPLEHMGKIWQRNPHDTQELVNIFIDYYSLNHPHSLHHLKTYTYPKPPEDLSHLEGYERGQAELHLRISILKNLIHHT